MKTKPGILTCFLVLCTTFGTMAGFGQTTYVWTNQFPGHLAGVGDMNQATNWSPNGVPNPMTGPDANGAYGDLMLFDGRTTGPLSVTESGGTLGGSGGQNYPAGARIELTSAQTNSVTIFSVVATSGGLRMNWFLIDAGSGGLILGDHSGNILDIVAGEQNGQIFGFTNNSATPSQIAEAVRWRMGGAGAHPFIFAGSGDWIVNNRLRSSGSSAILVQKYGPGTMTWTGTNNANASVTDQLGTPITIGGGTMIWKSSDLVGGNAGNPNIVHNGVLLKYDVSPAPGLATGPGTIAGNISGNGPIQINAGTVTFAGASTFTGNINLTGGELIAGSTENVGISGPLGQGGIISFNGGTLGWSLTNAFDYSSRFSAAANQVYNLDTGGSSPTLATGLSSSGGTLTKLGGGTLTLAGTSSYTGPTTVSVGKLVFQGPKTGSGDITVADGAALGVFDTGTPVTPNTLALGNSYGCTLEFNNVNSTTTAPLAAGNLSSAGMITINVNSGTFPTVGLSYPLLSWASGSAPAVSLGSINGAGGALSTNGNTIQLNITATAYKWTGLNNSCWDATTANNWTQNGFPTVFVPNNGPVLFDDTAPGTTSVTVCAPVQPTGVTVNNGAKTYSITSSGGNNIGGSTGLTKSGSGTLTLSGGANTYTGVTTLRGGTVVIGALANGGFPSDIGAASSSAANLVFDGGGMQYTGTAASIDRLFTVGVGSGTIDSSSSGALAFTNPGAVNLGGNLTLTGNSTDDNTLAVALFNSGGLTKSGTGTWILAGTNSYGGITTVASGVLQVGAGGNAGSIGNGNITNNSVLIFNRTGTLTVSGAIHGTGSVTNNGNGTVILANNNSYTGGTTINAGTLQLGNGGATGSLPSSAPIVNNSLLVFNTSGSFTYSGVGVISGSGNVIVQGGGVIKVLCYAVGYTGWTRIDAGATFQPHEGQDGILVSPVITNNGTLRLVSQDTAFTYAGNIVSNASAIPPAGRVQIGANNVNVGVITLTGTNTYAGGTYIGGNTLVLGDGVTPIAGSIAGNVQFVNDFTIAQDNPRILTFNRPDDFTFGGTITTNFTTPQANLGIVRQNGTGTLTLTGNNTYAGGTVINAGTVQVGNGGTNGSIGSGPVTLNGALVFNRSNSLTFIGVISGAGSLTKKGAGTLTLTSANTYAGATTINAGKLVFQGSKTGSGNITVSDSAALGVTDTGTQITPGTLTLGASTGCTLEFNNVNSTTTAPLAASTLSSAGTVTININSGTFALGQSYPLLAWTSGSAPVISLGSLNGAAGFLTISGKTLYLSISSAGAVSWTGNNNGSWDTTTTNNWIQDSVPTVFANGFPALFDDTATGTTTVTVNALVQPATLTVSNSALTYSIASSGGNNIAGNTGLSKNGAGLLTLSGGANSYTGGTTISGGTLSAGALANGGLPSDIGSSSSSAANLVLNGGALQYTGGGANIDRSFTLGTNGGTIGSSGSGALNLTNIGPLGYSGSGPRTFTLTGSSADTNTFAASLADNGGATSLTKSGTGKWVLTGTNTYSGATTIASGVLQVGAGGASGTLGVGNVTNNGALIFNRSGTLVVSGASSGTGSVTNLGSGTVILAGDNTYSGGTTINAGKLVFQGSKTGSGNITVSDNAALGVTDTGTQVTPGTLTLGASTGCTLEFNNVNSTTTAPLAANTILSAGTVTININSGTTAVGQSYPLLTWTSGSAPLVRLGTASGPPGNLTTIGNTIQFNVPANFVWSGNNNGNWDTTTSGNWLQNGSPAVFANGGATLFDDSAPGATAVIVNALVQPAALTVSNSALTYSIASSGGSTIAGNTGLIKNGTGTLTLSGGANSYTGGTTIAGGTLSAGALANGGLPSDIGSSSSSASNLVLNGGALRYIGAGANCDRLLTLGLSGGAIDASGSAALNLTNSGSLAYSGSGPRAFTLTGNNTNDNTLAASLADNIGATSLAKTGTGKWLVTGNNTYSGGTAIADGVLQVGVNGASGSLGSGNIANNGTLVFNRADDVTFANAISGSGSVTSDGWGSLSLAGDNTCSGGTVINHGTMYIHGKLNPNAPVVNNSQLLFYNADALTLNGVVSGVGTLLGKASPGVLTLYATNTFIGDLDIYEGSLIVNGSIASPYTYLWGGTLGGTGTLHTVFQIGGTLAPGASAGSIGTLSAASLQLGGNLAIEVNKALAQASDFVVVSGVLTNTGTGTITVSNLGPGLVAGDKFTLFNQPLQNGAAMTVVGAGVPWVNNLAGDGSIIVGPILPPGVLGFANLGSSIEFFWTGNFKLQAQTNNLNVGLDANWSDYSGGGTSPVTVTIDKTKGTVFFRLVALPTTIYVDSGTGGSYMAGQSYNETRAVDVTVLSPTNLVVSSMTLSGIAGSGLAKAVIYDSNTQSLVASAEGNLSGGTITLPISATLLSGRAYRIGFFGYLSDGTLFQPNSTPYTESSGLLRINGAWSIATDSFPANPNLDVPQISLEVIFP